MNSDQKFSRKKKNLNLDMTMRTWDFGLLQKSWGRLGISHRMWNRGSSQFYLNRKGLGDLRWHCITTLVCPSRISDAHWVFFPFNKLPADPIISWPVQCWDHLGTPPPGVNVGRGTWRGCWFWTEGFPLGMLVPSYSPIRRIPEE